MTVMAELSVDFSFCNNSALVKMAPEVNSLSRSRLSSALPRPDKMYWVIFPHKCRIRLPTELEDALG